MRTWANVIVVGIGYACVTLAVGQVTGRPLWGIWAAVVLFGYRLTTPVEDKD